MNAFNPADFVLSPVFVVPVAAAETELAPEPWEVSFGELLDEFWSPWPELEPITLEVDEDDSNDDEVDNFFLPAKGPEISGLFEPEVFFADLEASLSALETIDFLE